MNDLVFTRAAAWRDMFLLGGDVFVWAYALTALL
jgi:hypothetical protein